MLILVSSRPQDPGLWGKQIIVGNTEDTAASYFQDIA